MHTNHWRDGDTGEYFYFSEDDFEEMVGKDEDWGNKKFEVIQRGSQNWTGTVIVWNSKLWSGAHGRRDKDSNPGQWAPGDTIELKSCSQAGT